MSAISREVAAARHADAVAALTPHQREIYDECMSRDGPGSERFALMLALQSPPGSRNTDRAFCEGARRQMENMPAFNRNAIIAKAKAAGINTDGKFFKGSLGGYTDPAAWVSSADDVLAVCKARNLDCDGVIKHKAVERDVAPPVDVMLANDLVNGFEKKYLASEPGLAEKVKKNPKARGELRERIVATHGKKKRFKSRA